MDPTLGCGNNCAVVTLQGVCAQGGLKAELSPDGVHPNKAGYELMAPLAETGIAEALKKPLR